MDTIFHGYPALQFRQETYAFRPLDPTVRRFCCVLLSCAGVRIQCTSLDARKVEGLAAVKIGQLWGYVNRDGVLVIAPQFEGAKDFSKGMAVIEIRSSGSPYLYGFIDRSGTSVLPPRFESANTFSEGLAVVGDDKRYWYIDHEGRNAFSTKFLLAGSFYKGLAHVKTAGGALDYRFSGSAFFMWWDHFNSGRQNPVLGTVAIGVLQQILSLPNRACKEAALHGLNHLVPDTRVAAIIDGYLDENGQSLSTEEIAWASLCRDGKAN